MQNSVARAPGRSWPRRAWRAVAITAILILIAVLFVRCGLDGTANSILANAVGSTDREMPPTAYAIRASAADVLAFGGQGQGLNCSLPPGMDWLAFPRDGDSAPISLQMRQACAFHDYCYRHGQATYGYSQADCDYRLQEQAFRLCRYVNRKYSVSRCETDARKITLGVRLGGAGSYKRAGEIEDSGASTFFEYDPYPTQTPQYTVVRASSAPKEWTQTGAQPTAAYFFAIRPSGMQLTIVGWRSGKAISKEILIPARFDTLNAAPMVLRDGPSGEEWFVWWQRRDLTDTKGRFAALAPARATDADWKLLGSERLPDSKFPCYFTEGTATPPSDAALAETSGPPAALICPKRRRTRFSELHPLPDTNTDGVLRLVGHLTHSCDPDEEGGEDLSTCLVDVNIDTTRRSARVVNYRAQVRPVGSEKPRDGCPQELDADEVRVRDRYRAFVSAPYVESMGDVPRAYWLVRGAPDGEGYEDGATLRRYERGATEADIACDLSPLEFAEFPQTYEPAALVSLDSGAPAFLSLLGGTQSCDRMGMVLTLPKDHEKPHPYDECIRDLDTSWLWRAPMLVREDGGTRLRILFTKLDHPEPDFTEIGPPDLDLGVTLKVREVTLNAGECTLGKEQALTGLFAISGEERKELREEMRTALRERSQGCDDPKKYDTRGERKACRQFQAAEATRLYGEFLASTRGAPMVASSFDDDGRTDLLFADIDEPGSSVLLRGTANGFELVTSTATNTDPDTDPDTDSDDDPQVDSPPE